VSLLKINNNNNNNNNIDAKSWSASRCQVTSVARKLSCLIQCAPNFNNSSADLNQRIVNMQATPQEML
jgi:hypothetical protein